MPQFDVEKIRETFKNVADLKADTSVICTLTFSQFNTVSEPHVIGQLATLLVNATEVANITFTSDPGESKVKSATIDISGLLTQQINSIEFKTQVDDNFANPGFYSEASFTLSARGQAVVDEDYLTDLPLRFVDDTWLM